MELSVPSSNHKPKRSVYTHKTTICHSITLFQHISRQTTTATTVATNDSIVFSAPISKKHSPGAATSLLSPSPQLNFSSQVTVSGQGLKS